jgi:NhaP-type Na+/H+ or K+/H+ antiporter
MALGAVTGVLLFPGAGWATAALIATILAPTDSALGLAVVTNPVVPVRVRRALNVESGLNDGIAAPFVTLFLALVVADEQAGHAHWGLHSLGELGLAILGALVVGVGGGRLLVWSRGRGWTSRTSEQLAVLALALLAFEGAVAVGGNGLVCAFVAGILFGRASNHAFREQTEFSEAVALVLTFLVWTIFGAGLVGPVLAGGFHLTPLVYAVLSLTVVRMVPVAIALAGTGFRRDTVAFMGWFGPRGLASVVFTLLAATTLRDHGLGAGTIVEVATYTILLSVIAHGLTATPLSARYGARTDAATAEHAELVDAPEPRLRRRTLAH